MDVKFWGTRGAFPFYAATHSYLGGDTTAVEIACDSDRILIDSGSGLNYVPPSDDRDILLLSHCHLDHILGLPCFLAQKQKGNMSIISGKMLRDDSIKHNLRTIFGSVGFPVTLETIYDDITYIDLDMETTKRLGNWDISTHPLNHPGGATGFRISHKGSAQEVIYLLDHEHGSSLDKSLINFAKGADLIIWDGCYDDSDFPDVRGFGHSSWQQGLIFQDATNCRVVAITGHAVKRDDAEAHDIEAKLDSGIAFLARDRQLFNLI